MPLRNARHLCLAILAVVFLSGSSCSNNGGQHTHPPLSTPTAAYGVTGNPNGGPGAAPSAMSGNASILANLIMDYRQQAGLPVVAPNDVLAGVAQVQADDMASSDNVSLVGSDGEDVFQRLANSGYANSAAGIIAAGYSTDPQAVYDAMLIDNSADATLLANSAFNSIGVGYSNGYWMVILGTTSTATLTAPSLSAVAGTGSVSLTWTASPGATSYTLYRGAASGSETSYAAGVPGTTYTDTAVTNGTTYYYTVAAVASSGTSSPSNEVSARPTGTGLQITTASLPTWDAKLAGYSATLSTTGGTGTVAFSAGPGLPPGLSLGSGGTLTGTPTATGSYNIAVTASDSAGATASQSYALVINPPVTIVTTTLANWNANVAGYSATISTAGGTGSITLTVSSGSLPPGLFLHNAGTTTASFVSSGLNNPQGLAFDTAGNLYVANNATNTITKVTPAGTTSTFVSGLNGPEGLAFDSAGNLYVANYNNSTITMVTPAGVSSTFASGSAISSPLGLALDTAGNLYVANQTNNSIVKVTPAGATSTFITGGGLDDAQSPVFDTAGNLYIANYLNNVIIKVTPAGVTSTFVSSGLLEPVGLALDTAGNLYAANWGNSTITKVTPAGVTSTFVNSGLNEPAGLVFDTAGNLYAANWGNGTVTQVTTWATAGLAGTPTATGTYNFTVTASDTLGSTASQSYTVVINP